MALIAMAVHDTEENGRSEFTRKTLESLFETVDFSRHRLIIVDNASCEKTHRIYDEFTSKRLPQHHKYPAIIYNMENVGTAEAINAAWRQRVRGEHCIKLDNDVVIFSKGWADEMEEVVRRDKSIGQVGLKRKDLIESPYRDDWYKSELVMLPHQPGERWIIAESCNHIMGTCVLHSSDLLDKVGFLRQPKLYGLDDSLMSFVSKLSGFKNVFLPHIEIDHIDPGGTPYQKWKEDIASQSFAEYGRLLRGYQDGSIPVYYNPFK